MQEIWVKKPSVSGQCRLFNTNYTKMEKQCVKNTEKSTLGNVFAFIWFFFSYSDVDLLL